MNEDRKMPRRLLKEAETSRYIEMSRPWLRQKRCDGGGPPYLKIGRAIRYDISDLDRWLDTRRVACE
jgi:predicted DNA-binding transcriptional regulator AlpA